MTVSRQEGSGFATDTATAVENLIAATLRGDTAGAARQLRLLEAQHAQGRCGMSPREVFRLTQSVCARLNLSVRDARRALPGSPGDVEITTTSNHKVWVEVKAQTKKRSYADITQADWVRDATDTLRWLATHDDDFRAELRFDVVEDLETSRPDYFDGWSVRDLWLADIALITSRRDRLALGWRSPRDVEEFLTTKYLFHLTQEGARAVLLCDLPPVRAVLDGSPIAYSLKQNRVSLMTVPIAVDAGSEPYFSYHLYQPELPGTVKGRHKLHARSLVGAPFIDG